jgi:predicted phage terminase large subunit-like protein
MTEPDPDLTLNLALAERERRRRARLRAFPSYGDWLPRASPSLRWDYRWLRYVQGFYDRVTSGEIKKLMVFAPPQHGKSAGGTIRYPVYRMERDPRTRVIVACHSQSLANKFSRQSRSIALQRLSLSKERKAVAEWETTQGGGLKAVGVGCAIAGSSADLFFIDDPVKNRAAANSLTIRDTVWDWFNDDAMTRVQNSGATVLKMTRFHEDDLAGRILASEDGPNWTVVCLRALAEDDDPLGRALGEALCPERFSRETLLNRQLTMRLGFEALYQQRPTYREGGLFKRAWFTVVDGIPLPLKVVARVRHWDLAATDGDGDWTAGVLIAKTADGRFWVEDVVRFRLGPTDRDARILQTAYDDVARGRIGTKISLEQEGGSAGKAQCQALARLLSGFVVTYEAPTGSKEVRAEPYASQLGADNVRLCRDSPGNRWNASYVAEHVEFSNSKHDDQVDGSSGAFNRLASKRQSKSS